MGTSSEGIAGGVNGQLFRVCASISEKLVCCTKEFRMEETLLCARHPPKGFIYFDSFDPHNNPRGTLYPYLCFAEEDTEAKLTDDSPRITQLVMEPG